jgi:hypothetical protein
MSRRAVRWTLIALGLLAIGALALPYAAWWTLVWLLYDEDD